MVHVLTIVAQNPIRVLCFTYSFVTSSLLAVAERVLLAHYPAYQSQRTRIARAYLAAAAIHIPRLVHGLLVTNCPPERARAVPLRDSVTNGGIPASPDPSCRHSVVGLQGLIDMIRPSTFLLS